MRVTSTMDVARQLVSEGAREGTVILADEQTQGRGRLGRHWVSRPDDSLSLSVILYPTVRQLPQLNMVASLATVRAITGITGLKPLIKWPNDILLSGRKVCGILIENIFDGPALKAAVIGIGMNVNLDPSYFPEIAATATSLSIEAGRDLSLQDLTARLLQEMDQLYGDLLRTGTVHDSWIPFVETVGKQVRIRSGDHIEEGRVESVDAKGSLILRRPDGSRAALDAGEVTLQI
ncbi:MAG: biotin--[acetyl-CoA-carboxylase] ligase [Chloroflexi bacterium]|nr:biotin--[acetyl-CoA-carboxylase] ligase [Chloroflexota bacterium]